MKMTSKITSNGSTIRFDNNEGFLTKVLSKLNFPLPNMEVETKGFTVESSVEYSDLEYSMLLDSNTKLLENLPEMLSSYVKVIGDAINGAISSSDNKSDDIDVSEDVSDNNGNEEEYW